MELCDSRLCGFFGLGSYGIQLPKSFTHDNSKQCFTISFTSFAVETPTFDRKIMVFCGMKRDGTFGLKVFRDGTLNGPGYHRLLQYYSFAAGMEVAWTGCGGSRTAPQSMSQM